MLLGDLLARFDDETVASETILRLGDLSLVAALRERAEAEGETLGVYAAGVVRRFAVEASDETLDQLDGRPGAGRGSGDGVPQASACTRA